MTTLMRIAKQAEKFAADNSPMILTAIGVAGTVTTAVLTGKATIKAVRIVDDWEYAGEGLPTKETDVKTKVGLVWKTYVPPAVVGTLTIATIISANQIGTRRAAAMAAAYTLSERAFSEYREKIVEKIGENKERSARDDIAQDRVTKFPISAAEVILTGNGNVLCFEKFTGRYFHSDIETLKKAMNDLNYRVNNQYYASLSDFYDLIGLDHTTMSDDLGWNSDELCELVFSAVLSEDGRPCMVMDYQVVPIRDYSRVH